METMLCRLTCPAVASCAWVSPMRRRCSRTRLSPALSTIGKVKDTCHSMSSRLVTALHLDRRMQSIHRPLPITPGGKRTGGQRCDQHAAEDCDGHPEPRVDSAYRELA